MSGRKNVLTTGEVARICNVAPRTVSKWFDSGQLRGYRIPGSKDRRIPLNQLVRFMKTHGIPLDNLETGAKRLLVVDDDLEFSNALQQALRILGGFEVLWAGTAFEAGAMLHENKPHVILLDVDLPDISPKGICRVVRSNTDLREVCLIGTAKGLSEARGQALLQDGLNGFLAKPFDVRSLVQLIEELLPGMVAMESGAPSGPRGAAD
jgi:excisionase family DNA binding protein